MRENIKIYEKQLGLRRHSTIGGVLQVHWTHLSELFSSSVRWSVSLAKVHIILGSVSATSSERPSDGITSSVSWAGNRICLSAKLKFSSNLVYLRQRYSCGQQEFSPKYTGTQPFRMRSKLRISMPQSTFVQCWLSSIRVELSKPAPQTHE